MLLLNTCVGDIEASPQPSPWERAYRYSCLLISYKTNLAPSPTERAGGEASLSTLQMLTKVGARRCSFFYVYTSRNFPCFC